jgi:hypothetical protein
MSIPIDYLILLVSEETDPRVKVYFCDTVFHHSKGLKI